MLLFFLVLFNLKSGHFSLILVKKKVFQSGFEKCKYTFFVVIRLSQLSQSGLAKNKCSYFSQTYLPL